ncbi:MAG: hypothetical protein AAGA56_01865 [Myxococcota bacterium]
MTVELRAVSGAARGAAATLVELSRRFDPGVHIIVGRPRDGLYLLAHLVAGRETPGRGEILVEGLAPSRDPALRRRMGILLERPALPPFGTVADYLDALAVPPERLDLWGLGAWRDRRVDRLDETAARAVELLGSLSLAEPAALVLVEPLRRLASIEPASIKTAIAERGSHVTTLVFTSDRLPFDDLAPTVHRLRHGVWHGEPHAAPGDATEVQWSVVLADRQAVSPLGAALASDATLEAVGWDRPRAEVTMRARHGDVAMAALAKALEAAGRPAVVSLIPHHPRGRSS